MGGDAPDTAGAAREDRLRREAELAAEERKRKLELELAEKKSLSEKEALAKKEAERRKKQQQLTAISDDDTPNSLLG